MIKQMKTPYIFLKKREKKTITWQFRLKGPRPGGGKYLPGPLPRGQPPRGLAAFRIPPVGVCRRRAQHHHANDQQQQQPVHRSSLTRTTTPQNLSTKHPWSPRSLSWCEVACGLATISCRRSTHRLVDAFSFSAVVTDPCNDSILMLNIISGHASITLMEV